MKFKLGELFCGPGGMGLGAINAKVFSKSGEAFQIEHSWANDLDADTCNTYIKNLGNTDSVICQDVRTLDIDSLSSIDAFAYGFPCNDFSLVGEHKGFKGKYGPLYSYGVKVLNKFNPKFFVAENVGGITSANEGKAFKKIIKDLKSSGQYGYKLTVHKYKSEEYLVPQKRHRVIIVGIRKDLGLTFKVPAPVSTSENDFISSKMALESPPVPSNAFNHEQTKQSPRVVERLSYIKPGNNIWETELPDHLKLNVKGAKLSQIYRRLDPNKPSYTITGSGGGGTHGYHYSELRALTNRERARIQSFPDEFIFLGTKESVRKQIGMAVPPKLAEAIFTAILKCFAHVPYSSIEPNILSD